MLRLVPVNGSSASDLVIPLLLLATGISSAEHLPITAYTTAEGLAHNHINRIRQDSRGYLWFCTDGGLSRFDGYNFTNYTTEDGLPHSWVNDLLETRDGTYWIAPTEASAGSIPTHIQPDRLPVSPQLGSRCSLIAIRERRKARSRVNALAEDTSGSIWCATYDWAVSVPARRTTTLC